MYYRRGYASPRHLVGMQMLTKELKHSIPCQLNRLRIVYGAAVATCHAQLFLARDGFSGVVHCAHVAKLSATCCKVCATAPWSSHAPRTKGMANPRVAVDDLVATGQVQLQLIGRRSVAEACQAVKRAKMPLHWLGDLRHVCLQSPRIYMIKSVVMGL